MTLRDFWKSYDICHANIMFAIYIAKAWEDITETSMKIVWKNVHTVHSDLWIDKDELFKEVSNKIVKLAKWCGGVDFISWRRIVKWVSEWTSSCKDCRKWKESFGAWGQTKKVHNETAEAFHHLSEFVSLIEKMNQNTSRFLKVQSLVDNIACYDIQRKKESHSTDISGRLHKKSCPVTHQW